jgi:hypothetical protein
MQDCVNDLREAIETATPLLEGMTGESSRQPLAPGKWSPRQIIGHLIDSASNNHQRFVRAQFQDSLVFPGYEQDAWVAAQRYQDAPWQELVTLWRTFNLHIARVMESTPREQRLRPRTEHNLDELAWKQVPKQRSTTLDYFMADYVGHLKHHLAQILGDR